ncbi:MAG: hypothetical protein KAW12_07445 [Candidatus Aminicenantes bacterium]|nr:hypothetical protein [Candidatus Aminicenantes bacterium]
MPLKTSKSKDDVDREKEKIQQTIINRAVGKEEPEEKKIYHAPPPPIKKNRKDQEKKMLYMDDEFFAMWQTYISQQLSKGNKVTFQGVVEKLLKDFLRKNTRV